MDDRLNQPPERDWNASAQDNVFLLHVHSTVPLFVSCNAIDSPDVSRTLVLDRAVVALVVSIPKLLDTSALRDRIPTPLVPPDAPFLVVAHQYFGREQHLLGIAHAKAIFFPAAPLRASAQQGRIDHGRPVELVVPVIVVDHGENLSRSDAGDECRADPVVDEPTRHVLGTVRAYSRGRQDLTSTDPFRPLRILVSPQKRIVSANT